MIAEKQVFLRTSERSTWSRCRFQWWLSYVQKLEAAKDKAPLRFGGLVHAAFEPWYKPGKKRGVHPAKTFAALYKEQLQMGFDPFEEEKKESLELGISMLEHYVETYGKDEHLEVISPEMTFQVPVRDKNGKVMRVRNSAGRYVPLIAVGTGDVVVRNLKNRQIGLMETKTAAAISTRHLVLDEQVGSYWTFFPEHLRNLGILKPDEELDFVMYNILRKAAKDTRETNELGQALNQNGTVSKNQPAKSFHREFVWRGDAEARSVLKRVQQQAWEMDAARNGELPIYKSPSSAYPDKHCEACEFADACELHEQESTWVEMLDLSTRTWDPYEDHRHYEGKPS